MHSDFTKLNIARVGSNITFSSLKRIGVGILASFDGLIRDFDLRHYEAPVIGSIDALLLTVVLHEQYGGHTLGITDADLKTDDRDEFFNTIIGGIAPDWGPFGSLGNEAKVMIEVVMAVAILLCLGIAVWGAAKQRIGATALRDTFSAEQGKGLIIAGLTGVFIIGSLGTLFTIVYGMAV